MSFDFFKFFFYNVTFYFPLYDCLLVQKGFDIFHKIVSPLLELLLLYHFIMIIKHIVQPP